MNNFLQILIDQIKELSTYEVLSTILVVYFMLEYYKGYQDACSDYKLVNDFKFNEYSLNFFYESPHYYTDFVGNNTIFYNILLGRSLHKKLNQRYKDYHKIIAYDKVAYKKHYDAELLYTHRVRFSYPDYFNTYVSLKQQLIFGEMKYIEILDVR